MDVRLSMRVDDHEKGSGGAHAHSDKALLIEGIRVFPSERVLVIEHGRGLGKGDAVFADICRGLVRIPIDAHAGIVWTNVGYGNRAVQRVVSCGLTFELRRPTRQGALARRQTIDDPGCCREIGRAHV